MPDHDRRAATTGVARPRGRPATVPSDGSIPVPVTNDPSTVSSEIRGPAKHVGHVLPTPGATRDPDSAPSVRVDVRRTRAVASPTMGAVPVTATVSSATLDHVLPTRGATRGPDSAPSARADVRRTRAVASPTMGAVPVTATVSSATLDRLDRQTKAPIAPLRPVQRVRVVPGDELTPSPVIVARACHLETRAPSDATNAPEAVPLLEGSGVSAN